MKKKKKIKLLVGAFAFLLLFVFHFIFPETASALCEVPPGETPPGNIEVPVSVQISSLEVSGNSIDVSVEGNSWYRFSGCADGVVATAPVTLTAKVDDVPLGPPFPVSVSPDQDGIYFHSFSFSVSDLSAGWHTFTVEAESNNTTDDASRSFEILSPPPPPPSSDNLWVQLSADPEMVTAGYSTKLSWSSGGTTSTITCQGAGFSTGGASSGQVSVRVDSSTTYTVTCTAASSTASDSVTVVAVPRPTASASITPSKLVLGSGYFDISWGGGPDCNATLAAGIGLNVSGDRSFRLWTPYSPGGFAPKNLSSKKIYLDVTCRNSLGAIATARASADVIMNILHWYGYDGTNRLPQWEENQITFTAARDYISNSGIRTDTWPNSHLNDDDDRVWAYSTSHQAKYYVASGSVSTGYAYEYEYVGSEPGSVIFSDPTAPKEETIKLKFFKPQVTATLSSDPPSILRGGAPTLSWNSQNATDCFKIAGAGLDVSGTSGSDEVNRMAGSTVFSIRCYRDSNGNGQFDSYTDPSGKVHAEANAKVDLPVPVFYHTLNVDAAVYRGGCEVGQAEPMGADARLARITLNRPVGQNEQTEVSTVGVGSFLVWGIMPKNYEVISASAPGFNYCGSSAEVEFDSYSNPQTRTLTVYFAPQDVAPPSAPTNFQATGECFKTYSQPEPQVYLSWNPSLGARDYLIYRNGNLISTVSQTFYLDRAVSFDRSYSYTLVARNWAGESAPAGPVSANTPSQNSCSPPPPPPPFSPTYNIIPPETTILVGSTTQFIGLFDPDGPSGLRYGEFDVSGLANWGITTPAMAQSLGGGFYKAISWGGEFRNVTSEYQGILAYASLYANPSGPYFNVSLSPAENTLQRSSTTVYTVTVAPRNGFTGSVSLTAQNLPAGVTASFAPQSINITDANPKNSILTLSASESAAFGRFTFAVEGTSLALPGFSHSAQADVVVVPSGAYFTISLTPAERTVQKPGSTTYTVTVTPQNGFTGSVSLTAQNLPEGVATIFSPQVLNVTDNNAKTSTLTVNVLGQAPIGNFSFYVLGTSATSSYSASGRLVIQSKPGTVAEIYADPSIINPGEQSTLYWSSSNAVSCEINPGIGSVCNSLSSCENGGTKTVSPPVTTEYTLVCQDGNGNDYVDSAVLMVRSDVHSECFGQACVLVSGSGENQCSSNQNCGGENEFHSVCNNNACQIVPGPGINECVTDENCGISGGHSECISNACVFVYSPGYSQCSSDADCEAPPGGCSLKASPSRLLFAGMPVKLTWTCRNPQNITSCSINQGVGFVSPQGGQRIVRPKVTTTYTLSCTGNPPASATVNVGLKPIIREILPR